MQQHNSSASRTFLGAQALLPVWQMTQAQFEAAAICAAVDVVMHRGHLRLEASDEESGRALAILRDAAARRAPAGIADPHIWAEDGVKRMLGAVFQDDVFLGELPDIAHVVLVKKSQMDGLSLPDVLRRVHMRQVEDALSAGLRVPESIKNEYRDSMERMHVLAQTSVREILH